MLSSAAISTATARASAGPAPFASTDALYRHPAIQEAAVLPVPDELLGSRLRAVVTADGAGSVTRENVLDHCRKWLPGYMVPDVVEFRQALPRTSTGKVDRSGLAREQHELEPAGNSRRNEH